MSIAADSETQISIGEDFNLFKILSEKKNLDNPYPVYDNLRKQSPVFFMKSPTGFLSENIWVLTRYDDISKVLTDGKKFGRGNKFGKIKEDSKYYQKLNSLTKMRQHWVTFLDPPEHTRIRNLINKAFPPKMSNSMEPAIESVSKYLLEKSGSDEIELLTEFAYPIAAITIAELFGVPPGDRDIIDKWAMQIVRTLDVVTNQFDPDDLQNIYKCADEIKDYFGKIVDEKSKNPGEDLISRFLMIKNNEDAMTREEIISTLVLMTMDAHEAPKNLIGNGVYALLKNPEQLEKLRKNPSLMDNAVDEFLRFDSPAQFTGRRPNSDETINGMEIKKGVQLICILGAGNRDPEKFDNPDVLDIERKKIIPLSFGGGIHHCVGAGLGKLEAKIAIKTLLEKFSRIELKNKEYHFHDSLHSRGLEDLELKVS